MRIHERHLPLLIIPQVPAVSCAGFDRHTMGGPLFDATGINEQLFFGNPCVPEQNRSVLAVVTLSAIAINDDRLRHLTSGDRSGEVVGWAKMVQLIRSGNMARLIMVIIASIDKDHQALRVSRIMEKLYRLVAVG